LDGKEQDFSIKSVNFFSHIIQIERNQKSIL
jgi:hypothetical protein